MSQPAENTPDRAFTMPESSKDTEKATDKTEDSTAKSSQDVQQPKADVRGSTIEDTSQNNPTWNVPMPTEPAGFCQERYVLVKSSRVAWVHGSLPSSELTHSRTEIGVPKGLPLEYPLSRNSNLHIHRRSNDSKGSKGRMGSRDDSPKSTKIS